MTTVVGSTSNGFTFEGEYETSANNSVRWTATYRREGVYRGMRHGRIFDASRFPVADLYTAVVHDIQDVWVKEQ